MTVEISEVVVAEAHLERLRQLDEKADQEQGCHLPPFIVELGERFAKVSQELPAEKKKIYGTGGCPMISRFLLDGNLGRAIKSIREVAQIL